MNNYNSFNGELPYQYQLLNRLNTAHVPSTVKLKDNAAFNYYAKYFLQRAMSVYKFTLPETWDKSFFTYVLFCNGFVSVFDTSEYGVIPMNATLGGLNIYYQPKNAIIANPLLGNKELEIGKECELIKLMPDYGNVMDIVSHYSAQAALLYELTNQNSCEARLAHIFASDDKSSAKTFKEAMDAIFSGEQCVAVGEKKLFDAEGKPKWQLFENNLSANFIAPKIVELMNTIECQFDTEIGIPNANTDKRERLITDEVNANNVETFTKASLWLENIKDGFARVRARYDIPESELNVDWRIDIDMPRSIAATESEIPEKEVAPNV